MSPAASTYLNAPVVQVLHEDSIGAVQKLQACGLCALIQLVAGFNCSEIESRFAQLIHRLGSFFARDSLVGQLNRGSCEKAFDSDCKHPT